ncbi:MAG: cytochrome b/b6 domain-containing protein [Rubrivivax sp.]
MNDERLAPVTAVRVWDLPTRLFHWALVVGVSGSLVTALIGGNAMVWHFRCGFAIFTLLLFRLLWGVKGGRWSRFVSFAYAPSTLARYLRGQHRPDEHLDVGHSPLGSLSVFALLAVLAVQVGSGLFADDEISNVGPLNRFVSNDRAADLTGWHTEFGPWIIGALVLLHIAAITFYVGYRKRKLVRAMISGDKALSAATPASADSAASRLFALILLLICAAVVRWLVSFGG